MPSSLLGKWCILLPLHYFDQLCEDGTMWIYIYFLLFFSFFSLIIQKWKGINQTSVEAFVRAYALLLSPLVLDGLAANERRLRHSDLAPRRTPAIMAHCAQAARAEGRGPKEKINCLSVFKPGPLPIQQLLLTLTWFTEVQLPITSIVSSQGLEASQQWLDPRPLCNSVYEMGLENTQLLFFMFREMWRGGSSPWRPWTVVQIMTAKLVFMYLCYHKNVYTVSSGCYCHREACAFTLIS